MSEISKKSSLQIPPKSKISTFKKRKKKERKQQKFFIYPFFAMSFYYFIVKNKRSLKEPGG